MPFSTLDQDNDKAVTHHFAANFKGAWWYEACHTVINPSQNFSIEMRFKYLYKTSSFSFAAILNQNMFLFNSRT